MRSAGEKFRRVEFESCHAAWGPGELTIGNGWIERSWQIVDGELRASSIRDVVNGIEWVASGPGQPAPCPPWRFANEEPEVRFSAAHGKMSAVEEASLVIEVDVLRKAGPVGYRFQVFPSSAAIRVQLKAPAGEGAASAGAGAREEAPTGVEANPKPTEPVEVRDCLENFVIRHRHIRVIAVELRDQTDKHDELVFEREWLPQFSEWDIAAKGNLFIIEESLGGSGLIFLKHAPLPHARPVPCDADFTLAGRSRQLTLRGNGLGGGEGYPFAVLTYGGGKFGRIAALQAYQRQLRAFVPGRDGLFLSNTWGDRSRDARINEGFMELEVDAGARLGVEVIQIDDGWQRGVTANSAKAAAAGGVWTGFWKADPGFWEPHPERFPNGLARIIGLARTERMQFGLWFAPDSSDDFANWERDAAVLIALHRSTGVCYFKIDGVKVHTRAAEQNLHRFFDTVLEASAGRAVFDLDVTAESRPGYFGLAHAGPLFVENRYTDWHNYWPHQTLRNLWKLAHHVDPVRLRMEFLNNARNGEVYGDDPLAPGRYGADYLFATVMFSNPLGWFEVSHLPGSYFDLVAPLARRWKEHRDTIFSGRIYPVGEAPDGGAWTGFVSVNGSEIYLLMFRELTDRESYEVRLPFLPGGVLEAEVLGGEGKAEISEKCLKVKIERAQRFLFARMKETER